MDRWETIRPGVGQLFFSIYMSGVDAPERQSSSLPKTRAAHSCIFGWGYSTISFQSIMFSVNNTGAP